MRAIHLPEPLLEFGSGRAHPDIRFGISHHCPFDKGLETAPSEIRIGLIGTSESVEAVRLWLEQAADGIAAKDTRLVNLFPRFPGFSEESCFGARLVFSERWTATLTAQEVRELLQRPPTAVVAASVQAFVDAGQRLVEQSSLDVIVCAPPSDLMTCLDESVRGFPPPPDQELDEGGEGDTGAGRPAFHDLLKARGMPLGVPLQMIRPRTYGVADGRTKKSAKPADLNPLQDPATRAWNLHTAFYYKAGGIPWRIRRDPAQLSSCFAGVSFYWSLDRDKVLTSVAQVFNERGEGIIVRGAPAQITNENRQPHLGEDDAYTLIQSAVGTFRSEHRHLPARLVIHKTSGHTPGEIDGFQAAAHEAGIEVIDLVSVRRSHTRLFRIGNYPPLRGTILDLAPNRGLLYLRGSVEFFECYPGLYVPRPLELRLEKTDSTFRQLAAEMLSLSKLNWNNTQFDGGEPITVRAARRVGDILKCIPEEGGVIQPSFRYFM